MKAYTDLAAWWPMFSPPSEDVEEAAFALSLLEELPQGATMLELGCGGGSMAFHLKQRFAMTLTDISEGMLAVCRATNPECETLVGDMMSLRLRRECEAVFVHDAICYATTEDELRATIETAAAHYRAGGTLHTTPISDSTPKGPRVTLSQVGQDLIDEAKTGFAAVGAS